MFQKKIPTVKGSSRTRYPKTQQFGIRIHVTQADEKKMLIPKNPRDSREIRRRRCWLERLLRTLGAFVILPEDLSLDPATHVGVSL